MHLFILGIASQPDALLVFWDARFDLSKSDRFITANTDWSYINFNPYANIKFAGCNTAGWDGQKRENTIAQDIADKTAMTVWGYVSNSHQANINGGYYQVADDGSGYVRVGSDRIRVAYPYVDRPWRWYTY